MEQSDREQALRISPQDLSPVPAFFASQGPLPCSGMKLEVDLN